MLTLSRGDGVSAPMTEVFAMWNWLLLAVIVGGLVALFAVAAVRQRRYAGDKPIGEQKRENFGKMEPRLPRKDRGLHGPGRRASGEAQMGRRRPSRIGRRSTKP